MSVVASRRAPPDGVAVLRADEAASLVRRDPERFVLRVPAHWRCAVARNPHALDAQQQVLDWFLGLGCSAAELERAGSFDVAGYMGIPFPLLSRETAVRIGKYLSLWLLWDDVHVEALKNAWRIAHADVLANRPPPGMSRFDQGWWQLFRELAGRRSARWIEDLCAAMCAWSAAAVDEARAMKAHREHGTVPAFADQVELRIATIGMYATVYLLEDEYDRELPRELHADPTVRRLKRLANLLVGLGNDIFSLPKDLIAGQLNLVPTLMRERGLTADAALEAVVRMHEEAIDEYDRLAASLQLDDRDLRDLVSRWAQDVRYASVGFTVWESQAPRYATHKLIVDGQVLEPRIVFGSSRQEAGERWG